MVLYIQHMAATIEKAALVMARDCLAMRARRLDRLITRLYDDALRPYGLRSTQLTLLVGIRLAGPVRASDLGSRLGVEKSTMSRNVSRLAERGWIVIDDAGEGRGQLLSLSATGEALIESAYVGWRAAQRHVQGLIGEPLIDALKGVHE